LHQFVAGKKLYTIPSEDFYGEITDYRKIKLDSVMSFPKAKIIYEYDFGDGWEHSVVLEKIVPREKSTYYPVCMDGKRNCPPEDCGGPGGYADLLEITGNPKHEEYREMIEWLGEGFDPEEFDIDTINELLQDKDYGCIELFD
jgi:hypothetical protein